MMKIEFFQKTSTMSHYKLVVKFAWLSDSNVALVIKFKYFCLVEVIKVSLFPVKKQYLYADFLFRKNE